MWNYILYLDINDDDVCFFFYYYILVNNKEEGRLTPVLSITSVTSFKAWILADDITTEIGISFLSDKNMSF